MYDSITKECECGNNQEIVLDDEVMDKLDMNGYVVIYCEECNGEIDVNSDDLESNDKDEYGVYEIDDETDDWDY